MGAELQQESAPVTVLDYAALAIFLACWLGLQPCLNLVGRHRPCITTDMQLIRTAWMRQMLRRDVMLVDAQIIGHTIHSASFFGSANLLVIVGIGGAVFSTAEVPPGGVELHGTRALLLLAPLLRGLFDFIWSVRQLNYFLAAMAASPLSSQSETFDRWAPALSAVLTRSLSTFSRGVQNYYFAFAAALWLLGAPALIAGSLSGAAFLVWRQTHSPTAARIHDLIPLLPDGRGKVVDDHSAARASDAP
jgi:uncharacterized membrane protein